MLIFMHSSNGICLLAEHQHGKVLYLEIGIGYTTPQFVKHPFQRMTRHNPDALL